VVESSDMGQLSNLNVEKMVRQDWNFSTRVGDIPNPLNLAHGWEIRFLPMEGGQFEDGLRDKWQLEMVLANQPLQDWRTIGRGQFSGTAEYSTTFQLDESLVGNNTIIDPNKADNNQSSGNDIPSDAKISPDDGVQAAVLDLGDVRETARVILNGKPVGDLLWPPYRLRVEQFLQPGENSLTVVVTNTMANRLEPIPLPSGLLGPVSLVFGRKVKLVFRPEVGG